MIDKSLVKKRFQKSFASYDDNAIVQKQMAAKLINLLPEESYDSVFEIGCATGILTKEIKNRFDYKNLFLNDIVEESEKYVKRIVSQSIFINGDIEEITFDKKFDLIISNASLQWCNDIVITLKKLINSLNPEGCLAVSIFGDNNLSEIKNIFNIENTNYSVNEIREFLALYNVIHFEENQIKLYFDSPYDVIKHMKNTGVNAVKQVRWTKKTLSDFEYAYKKMYSEENKAVLTYNPVYFVIKNSIK